MYINYLEDLQARFKDMSYIIMDEQLMDQILGTIGKEYEHQAYRLKLLLKDNKLTVKDICTELCQCYVIL